MEMKIMWNVVNELKGDLKNSFMYEGEGSEVLLCNRVGKLTSLPCDKVKDFHTLVAEMETNFGTSIKIAQYNKQLEIKMVGFKNGDFVIIRNVDSDVVDSLVCVANNNGFISDFVCVNPRIMYIWNGEVRKADTMPIFGNKLSVKEWLARPEDNTFNPKLRNDDLIYTKEMADNGDLPSVNNEVMYQYGITNYAKGTIKGVDGNQYWIKADCGGYIECNISKLKPLTPPVTLIDGKAYQFDSHLNKNIQGIYVESGEIFLTCLGSFSVLGSVNIKPLTLQEEL